VVADRIVPSFARNWLSKCRDSDLRAAYYWIDRAALGFLHAGLLGVAMLDADLPQNALTAGAIGTMILAAMTRVTRGHTGRDLSADRVTSLIHVLATLAAIARVAAAFGADLHAARDTQ
jgi:uncharacterized protein involved in response to NO